MVENPAPKYSPTGADEVHVEETRPFFSHVNAKEKKVPFLHHAVMETLRPLVDALSESFELDGKLRAVWYCSQAAVWYSCNIAEGKEMSYKMRALFTQPNRYRLGMLSCTISLILQSLIIMPSRISIDPASLGQRNPPSILCIKWGSGKKIQVTNM